MATKRLAKELGFVRKRSQSTSGQRKTLISKQIFSYLIVIDFESTCWREKNNYGQEIIEFPAVLVSTATGEVESEFHTYVQPQEHPTLSNFCTELTGITQGQVEKGVPLQICLSRFNRWLQTLQLQKGVAFPREQRGPAPSAAQKPCAFLTWSDWDLGVCLQYECKRKQLHKPDVLNSWIDLRATYRLFYNRKPKGLNGALQDLGIQFSGREHSGLDDARNTARLAVRMMRDGCVMKITRSQERAPLKDKPIFGNTNVQTSKQREKDNTAKEQEIQTTTETPKNQACLLKTHSSASHALDTKGTSSHPQEAAQGHRSLVSPRTLLNGLTTPLLGTGVNGLVRVETATKQTLPNNKMNSLILFSTTVDCLTHLPQPQQTSEPEVTADLWGEEEGVAILVEAEERCGAYDAVVLEEDDVTRDSNTERGERREAEETGRSLPGESAISHSVMGEFSFESSRGVTKKPDGEVTLKPQIGRQVGTSLCLHHKAPPSIASVSSNETRMHSSVSPQGLSFTVPKAVTCKPASSSPRQHTVALGKPPTHLVAESSTTHTATRNLHTISLVKTNATVSSETCVRPKPVGTKRNPCDQYSGSHKETVSNPFTVYTDPAKPTVVASYPTKKPLSSSSSSSSMKHPSILSSSTNRSSFPPASRGKGSNITAPLCACGRRAKRLTVANGGPNHGRGFYCCPVRRSGSGNGIQKGCQFFKWESALIAANCRAPAAVGSSISAFFNSGLNRRPLQTSSRKSY